MVGNQIVALLENFAWIRFALNIFVQVLFQLMYMAQML